MHGHIGLSDAHGSISCGRNGSDTEETPSPFIFKHDYKKKPKDDAVSR